VGSDFLRALIESPTFLPQFASALLAVVACLLFAAAIAGSLARRTKRRRLHRDERGVAAAVDFVLTVPLFMAATSLIVQFALLMQTSMAVHWAAYVAARSVRVHAWEAVFPLPPTTYYLRGLPQEVRDRAERAARIALIAASPSDSRLPLDPGLYARAARDAGDWLAVMARNSAIRDVDARTEALQRKAAYAFYPDNARVDVKVELPPDVLFPTALAQVEFHAYTNALYGRLLGEKRADGLWYAPVRAVMRVL
jgi:hypothetical protein